MQIEFRRYVAGAVVAVVAVLPLLGRADDDLDAKQRRFAETAQLSLEQVRAATSEKECEEALRILGPVISEARKARQQGLAWTPDMRPLRKALAIVGQQFPDTDIGMLSSTGMSLFEYLQAYDRKAFETLVVELQTNPNPRLRELSAGFQERARIEREPMTLTATAIDGREINLEKLRGKVVLVQFWSTGCVPCVNETPEIQRVYAKYRPQGFEVIGISMGSGPGAMERLLEFVKDNEVPWPQFDDEGGWNNRFAVQYAVKRKPTAFLLDREGKLVSTDARPPRLEQLVTRHMGLSR